MSVEPFWYDHIPLLEGILRKHFPDAPDLKAAATEIYDGWSCARELQRWERMERRPAKDIQELRLLASNIIAVTKKLRGLGLHGAVALTELASRLTKEETGFAPVVGRTDSHEIVARYLDRIAGEIDEAALQIDPRAGPWLEPLSMSSEWPGRGRPPESEANSTAHEIAKIFEALGGRRPTITVDPSQKRAPSKGPFLELVEDCFEALEIKGSALTAARYAVNSAR